MHSVRHMATGIAGTLIAAGMAAAMFIWPNYREASAVRSQVAHLASRMEAHDGHVAAVELLATEVQRAQDRAERELKLIGAGPDVAALIRHMSSEIDGVHVMDQTFTAGKSASAPVAGADNFMIQPVMVEMRGRFAAVMGLISRVESLGRLVRVSSVRIGCDRATEDGSSPEVQAAVCLEVVYASGEDHGRRNASQGETPVDARVEGVRR